MPTTLPPYPVLPTPEPTPAPPGPGARPGNPGSPGPIDVANELARPPIEYQLQTSAAGAAWPIIYGEAIVGAKILAWQIVGSKLYISAGWCLGEVEEIRAVYANNATLDTGVEVTHYVGDPAQIVDPTMAAVIDDYADTNVYDQAGITIGAAYTVFMFPHGSTAGFPQLSAKIRGMKSGLGGTYSVNPARHLADFLSSPVYGAGLTVNAASAQSAAEWCFQNLGSDIERMTAGIIIDTPRRVEDWIDVLKSYALCFVVREGSEVRLIPDKPGTSVRSITSADIVQGSFHPSKRSLQKAPTEITVRYTDTSKLPWREATAKAALDGVGDGTVPLIPSSISLPGIKDYGAAIRKARTMLNGHTLVDLDITFDVYDENLDLQIGDIIDITHPYGYVAKLVRIMNISSGGRAGLWRFDVAEHSDLIYSDEIQNTGNLPDSPLPTPLKPPDIDSASLTMTEEIVTNQVGIVISRFRVTWDGVDWPFAREYRIRVIGTGLITTIAESHLGAESHSIEISPISDNSKYIVTIQTVSFTGNLSPGVTTFATALGAYIPPPNVTGLSGFEVGQYVRLTWNSVTDIGFIKYLVRRGDVTDTWGTAVAPAGAKLIASTFFIDEAVPAGTWRYFLKALDNVGLESAVAAYIDIDVTEDTSSHRQTNTFVAAGVSVTNMHAYSIDGDAHYFVTQRAGGWSARFGTTYDGTTWWEGHGHAAGAAFLTSDEWDITLDRNGNWFYSPQIELLGTGAASERRIMTATAAAHPTFTEVAGSAVVAVARYMKFKIKDAGGADTRAIKVRFPIVGQLKSASIEQKGTANVPVSPQPLTVAFTQPYVGTPDVAVTLTGTTPRVVSEDNVTPTTFDLYAWNPSTGAAAAATVKWVAKGT